MKSHEKKILSGLLVLLALALVAVIFTRDWANDRERLRAARSASRHTANPVDMRQRRKPARRIPRIRPWK